MLVVWLGKERIICQSHAPTLWPRTVKTLEILGHVHAHLDCTLAFLSLPFIIKSQFATQGPAPQTFRPLQKTCLRKAQAVAVLLANTAS